MSRHLASRQIASVLVALSTALPATAADFTFEVPVTIDNIPALRRVDVRCRIFQYSDDGKLLADLGWGSSSISSISGGRYSGTVRVEVNASSTPSSANRYDCLLGLHGVDRDGREFYADPCELSKRWPAATGQSITVEPRDPGCTTRISGRITR